jgi:hypothetical protein
MSTMLEIGKMIYAAIGIEHPRRFIALCAIVGALLFGCAGWLIVKGVQAKMRQQAQTVPTVEGPKNSGNATTSGDKSPATTGNGNSFTYDEPPDSKEKPKPKPPK